MIELAFRTLIDVARARSRRRSCIATIHSRNLLVVESNNPATTAPRLSSPGIIDFQGAMLGPVAYDLASLLRDCYIAWRCGRVDGWVEGYRQRLRRTHGIDRRRRRAFPPLVRSDRTAAAHQGARHFLPAVLSRRQGATILPICRACCDYVLAVARRYPELAALARSARTRARRARHHADRAATRAARHDPRAR